MREMGCWLSKVDEEPVSVAYSGNCQQLGKEVLVSKGSWKVIRKQAPLCDVKKDLALARRGCRENGAELALAMHKNKAEWSERGTKVKCSEVLGRLDWPQPKSLESSMFTGRQFLQGNYQQIYSIHINYMILGGVLPFFPLFSVFQFLPSSHPTFFPPSFSFLLFSLINTVELY